MSFNTGTEWTTKMPKLKQGMVLEWTTAPVKPHGQLVRIVIPECGNAGSLDHAGSCRCAPDPKSPEVVEHRKQQAYLKSLLAPKDLPLHRRGRNVEAERSVTSDRKVGRKKSLTVAAKVIGSVIPKKQAKKQTRGKR